MAHISTCAFIAPFPPVRVFGGQKEGGNCFREKEENSPFAEEMHEKYASIPKSNWNGFGVRRSAVPLLDESKASRAAFFTRKLY